MIPVPVPPPLPLLPPPPPPFPSGKCTVFYTKRMQLKAITKSSCCEKYRLELSIEGCSLFKDVRLNLKEVIDVSA